MDSSGNNQKKYLDVLFRNTNKIEGNYYYNGLKLWSEVFSKEISLKKFDDSITKSQFMKGKPIQGSVVLKR